MKFGTGLIDETTAWRAMEPLLIQVGQERPGDPLARALTLNFNIQNLAVGMDAASREATMHELLSLLPKIPSDTWVRENVANSLRFFEALEESLLVIQAGLMLDPLSADLYSAQGQTFIDMKRYEEAEAAFARAIELAPDNPNHYSDMSELAQKTGHLARALDWNRKAIEKDPQDHELVAQMSQTLFLLGLTEEGSRWASRCYALAPQTAVCRRLQLDESRARNDSARLLELSTAMLKDDVEMRRWAFYTAIHSYADVMMEQGRAREAFDYLASLYPGIAEHEKAPANIREVVTRNTGLTLMTQFAPREEVLAAQELFIKQMQAAEVPWLDSANFKVSQLLVRGDIEQAKRIALNEQLAEDVASSLDVRYRYQGGLYRELAQQPEVAARLREREDEVAMLRSEVETMLLNPEWDQ
jgi:tetratricopeptide (TPR) repeat protein